MRDRVAALCGLLWLLFVPVAVAAGGDIGIVLMHGKGGTPDGHVAELASALRAKGYQVSTPAMPWSKDRIYDASFEGSMREIDREVEALRAMSPGHNRDGAAFVRRLGTDLARAKELIAAGKGKDKQSFGDLNQGQMMRVSATPEVYVSWLDPDGRAIMAKSAAAFRAPTPLLVIVGKGDR